MGQCINKNESKTEKKQLKKSKSAEEIANIRNRLNNDMLKYGLAYTTKDEEILIIVKKPK